MAVLAVQDLTGRAGVSTYLGFFRSTSVALLAKLDVIVSAARTGKLQSC